MAKKGGKNKVKTTSSGVKKKQHQKPNNYTPNLKTGVNPNTGKEFFILVLDGGKLTAQSTTYQTRVGAERVRTSANQMIVEKSNIINHIKKWKKKRIDFNDIKKYLPTDWARIVRIVRQQY